MKEDQISDGIIVLGQFLKYDTSTGKDKVSQKEFTKSTATLLVAGSGKDELMRVKVPEDFVPPARMTQVQWLVKYSQFKEFLSWTLVKAI